MTDVLDCGFVELTNHMGTDLTVVNAARQSFDAANETEMNERNVRRLKTMLSRGHTSPFEMVTFQFQVKLPIFVARQWMRHRTGSFNETSLRYTEAKPEFYKPSFPERPGVGVAICMQFQTAYRGAWQRYQLLCANGAPKEVARAVLPVGLYTSFFWRTDLYNLLHFLDLRTAPGAQWEIRQYAEAIVELVRPFVPVTIEAWEEKHGV